MPRQYLIDTTGVLHHVIGRGIDHQKIFTDKNDYLLFLRRLAARIKKSTATILLNTPLPSLCHEGRLPRI